MYEISTSVRPLHGKRVPKPLIALDDEERAIVERALAQLRERGAEEYEAVERRFSDLRVLGEAVSLFPSVGESQRLGTLLRGPETLEASLCRMSGISRMLHTPTRVVAGRSFLVAKVHAFSFAALTVSSDAELCLQFRKAILNVVFSLLAEDVYLACLADTDFPEAKKELLAADLVLLWDDRRDPRAMNYVPALTELWSVRDGQVPVYGTMEGASELTRLSLDLSPRWFSFMTERLEDQETVNALEEFLFGLSYEEIEFVRGKLAARGICSADPYEVRDMLDGTTIYAPVDGTDPRAMYEFYAARREASRSRILSKSPGPRRTLEELYVHFMMTGRS